MVFEACAIAFKQLSEWLAVTLWRAQGCGCEVTYLLGRARRQKIAKMSEQPEQRCRGSMVRHLYMEGAASLVVS